VKVLVVGGGGREHALVRALARSPQRPQLLCAPGNAGIARDARVLDIAADDVTALVRAAQREGVELVVVGPEAPLVGGLVDALQASGIAAFGPSKAAAKLEGSKAFAKEIMEQAGVPTARWRAVASLQEGLAAVDALTAVAATASAEGLTAVAATASAEARTSVVEGGGVVVKADGLAAGKGVTVARDTAQARSALEEIFLGHRFGEGARAIVEERLIGEELSLLALCDGERALALAPARDYKRIGDGDTGPNTGGMGSYSPVAGVDEQRVQEIVAAVHQPVVDALRRRGTPFHGVLYAGLMMTAAEPKVLEFNVRFGDPETQAVLPRLRSDLLELLLATTRPGGLAGVELEWSPQWAVTIVLASRGYPASSSSGDEITGLERVGGGAESKRVDAGTEVTPVNAGVETTIGAGVEVTIGAGVEVTHAGTAERDGKVVTDGGRVLNVTALGDEPRSARAAAYAGAEMISFPGMQMRSDIAAAAGVPAATVMAGAQG
jgi:phosphoribosylamine--glycine ligase